MFRRSSLLYFKHPLAVSTVETRSTLVLPLNIKVLKEVVAPKELGHVM